ncbi:histidine phosphatase family protein [Candidatus Woesearchaeota archaeon]|nr:histidine phosphatase family protein [Candidatus Woesearchaeota archaeon]
MKTIYFIRHARPEPPFDNYHKIPRDKIEAYAKGTLDPGIHPGTRNILQNKFNKDKLFREIKNTKVDILYSSPVSRAKQTSIIIAELLKIHSVAELASLAEVRFDFKNFINPKDKYIDTDKTMKKLIIDWLDGNNIEDINDTLSRIQALLNFLEKSEFKNIICVSHGVLMGFIQFYSQGFKTQDKIKEQFTANFIQFEQIGFLHCIKIQL